jgi:hypothetical protein
VLKYNQFLFQQSNFLNLTKKKENQQLKMDSHSSKIQIEESNTPYSFIGENKSKNKLEGREIIIFLISRKYL